MEESKEKVIKLPRSIFEKNFDQAKIMRELEERRASENSQNEGSQISNPTPVVIPVPQPNPAQRIPNSQESTQAPKPIPTPVTPVEEPLPTVTQPSDSVDTNEEQVPTRKLTNFARALALLIFLIWNNNCRNR